MKYLISLSILVIFCLVFLIFMRSVDIPPSYLVSGSKELSLRESARIRLRSSGFFLNYRSREEEYLSLLYRGSAILQLNGEDHEELDSSQTLRQFSLLPSPMILRSIGFKADDSFILYDLSIEQKGPQGIQYIAGELRSSISWHPSQEEDGWSISAPLLDTSLLHIHYSLPERSPLYEVLISLVNLQGEKQHYELSLFPGSHNIVIPYDDMLSTVYLPSRDFDAKDIQLDDLFIEPHPPSGRALSADTGIMLTRPPSLWRQPDYELYSWSRYPSVLFLVSRNYEIQSQFFRRMVFFTEKRGFRGQLLSDEKLKQRRGWNAHNYSADSVAAFFTAAFPDHLQLLGEEENILMSIALENDLIRKTSSGFISGKGSILAFSFESPPSLRRLFMNHEAFHGLYYEEEDFAHRVLDLWNMLDDEVKDFWRYLLAVLSYESDWDFLVPDEYQAYLLQQEIEELPVALGRLRSRVLRFAPSQADYINDSFNRFTPIFLEHGKILSDYILSEFGIVAGRVSDLQSLVLP